MDAIGYAIELETQISSMIGTLAAHAGLELNAAINVLVNHQAKTLAVLESAKGKTVQFDVPIDISVLFEEQKWQEAVATINSGTKANQSIVSQLCLFWTLQTYYDKTFQFYRQASQNTPIPTAKYFYSTLAEAQGLVKRRIDAIIRVLSNEVWGQVGFAPYIIGKE